jgi:hypothetical protein
MPSSEDLTHDEEAPERWDPRLFLPLAGLVFVIQCLIVIPLAEKIWALAYATGPTIREVTRLHEATTLGHMTRATCLVDLTATFTPVGQFGKGELLRYTRTTWWYRLGQCPQDTIVLLRLSEVQQWRADALLWQDLQHPQGLTQQASMQEVSVENAEGVHNDDRVLPHHAHCVIWSGALIRLPTREGTVLREVVSNTARYGHSCPRGTQYHDAERP